MKFGGQKPRLNEKLVTSLKTTRFKKREQTPKKSNETISLYTFKFDVSTSGRLD